MVGACSISSRFHGVEAVGAAIFGEDFGKTDKAGVRRRLAAIVGMHVPTETVGLPDDESCARDGDASSIKDATCNCYDFALRSPYRAFDSREVAGCDWSLCHRVVGPRIW